LADVDIKFSNGAACCVVMASNGYPQSYEKGYEITIDSDIEADVFIAGATLKDGKLLTSGGRVLGVVSTACDLKSAVEKSYKEVEKVHFDNAFYRKDIGKRALAALK
jgi:phosphoribosylamine--glycine ligase